MQARSRAQLRTVGIVVEYNPLHYGHVHHFEQAKLAANAEAVIAVMSGHFLQRGEPALVGKWARAEMALRMGADVVLELPVAFAAQPAQWFAHGAVSALAATGVTDALCFGSESGSLAALDAVARRLHDEPDAFRRRVREQLKTGRSYPSAYHAAVLDYADGQASGPARSGADGGAAPIEHPNNSLGLHYLMALRRLGSPIEPLTIARTKAGYHQETITDLRIASATAIRNLLFEQDRLEELAPYVPSYSYDILVREIQSGRGPMNWERFGRQLLHRIVSQTEAELERAAEVTEGLEYRIKHAVARIVPGPDGLVEQLLRAVKTKRYTRTKVQRTLLRLLLGHGKDLLSPAKLADGVPYLRVLGFSERGRELLKRMKRTAAVPVVVKPAKGIHPYLDLDIDATGIYALGYDRPDGGQLLRDYYEPPLRV